MSTAHAPARFTVDDLVAAVGRLSSSDLHRFKRRLADWEGNNGKSPRGEATLLTSIERNSRLPLAQHRRYEQLRRKCERRDLSESELAEYQGLLQQLETRNVRRLEALSALAKLRGKTLREVAMDLGLGDGVDAE